MEVAVLLLGLSLIVGIFASRRGRSGLGWFVLSLFISPLLAGLFVAILGNKKDQENQPNPNTHIKCPDCRELVIKDARVCKHCGCKLIPQ